MRIIIPAIVLSVALAACTADEDAAEVAIETIELEQTELLDEQKPATEDDQDQLVRERRQRLREAMREHRQAAQQDLPSEMPRRALTRRDLIPWWQTEAIVAEIGLNSDQIDALEQAASAHRQAVASSRQDLAELRRRMSRNLAEGDSEQAVTATGERDQLRQQIAHADRQWEDTVEDILEPAQLEQLVADHPEALRPPGRRQSTRRQSIDP